MHPSLDAFFSSSTEAGRLYLHHRPPGNRPVRGAVLFIHPFAEEMNKSRRMAGMASRALANDGWAVLQVDLQGCGDSRGDFGDASWQGWVDDVQDAARWLRSKHPGVPLWLWGLRAGALLACAAAPGIGGALNFLFWQPVLQGKTQLQQFLRLKAAAQLADGGGKAIMAAVRADLAAGRSVEVGGYQMSATLAQGLEAASCPPPAGVCGSSAGRAIWLEVSGQNEPSLSPATQAAVSAWRTTGWQTDSAAVQGPAFWQTTEIEDATALVQATRQRLAGAATTDALAALPAGDAP